MVFLGMKPRPKTAIDRAIDPLKMREATRDRYKMVQHQNWMEYEVERKEMAITISAVEGFDIKEKMLKERRDWVAEQKALFNKIPPKLDGFHNRFNEQPALTPEEELARQAAAEEAAKAKKDKKKKKKASSPSSSSSRTSFTYNTSSRFSTNPGLSRTAIGAIPRDSAHACARARVCGLVVFALTTSISGRLLTGWQKWSPQNRPGSLHPAAS